MGHASRRISIEGRAGSLTQRVFQALREGILDLSFPPGTVLRKGVLCEALGVSRSPVTEALARLSAEGLVDIVPQSATRVSRFSMSVIREESFLREAVELAAVARVAETRNAAQLTALSRNLRLQALLIEDGDYVGLFEADEAFHGLILDATGFPHVASTVGQMSQQLRRARILLMPETGRPAETVAEHEDILAAIRDRDPVAARAAMARHLGQLISRIVPLERAHPDYFRAP
ncbi:GntR family transcriptional regulator [uncultured Limimaricola sp.]|uniref:GntR family transcriptional regulator n=1 Tax=uncultured Limimaricola sp. TaxID=2211667 RepID=UPI0030FBBEB6